MGNNESLLAERPKNRLSKPRVHCDDSTRSTSPTITDLRLSLEHDHPLTGAVEDTVNTSSSGESRSSPNARHQLWSHLSDNSWLEESFWKDDAEGRLGELAATLRDKWLDLPGHSHVHSPTASTTRIDGIAGATTLPLMSEGGKVDVEATIAVLRELSKTATPEDLVALRE